AAIIGIFASWPPYAYNSDGAAQLKLSLSHPGQRKVKCRQRTQKELAKLPPNMRAPKSCPRERWPVHVAIDIDGKTIMRESAAPNGLSHDGPSIFYRVQPMTAGKHTLALRLRERDGDGFDYEKILPISLRSGQVLAVEFHAEKGGFVVK
ncbi:MAG: hypothetical protein HN377_07455, partial [Alphaproteobacteria bacterium]|nr:hypothetical protein [Alphaproteobacteria bacterium]